ncbi:MAG: YicC/YloC family endoribonuclease [Candidatus Binatia bacterium]
MRSMTGFGQASWQSSGKRLSVEVRSVNQRFLDVKLSLPRECQAWEAELRELVSGVAERGKVDVTVYRAGTASDDFTVEANETLARAILAGWQGLQRQLKLPGAIDIGLLMARSTDLVRVVERRADASADLPQVRRLLAAALKDYTRSRDREGKLLQADMLARLKHLRALHAGLQKRTAALVPELARRLSERVAQLLGKGTVSEERLVQEAALLAERCYVTEELVRLDSHLDRLGELLRQKGSVGKAIDFLIQEIHREVNTVASKSADLEVTNLTLEAKGEIEKLREQVQNVE